MASDGRAGLELLRAGSVPKPYVVLLDLNLPRMNGVEMLAAIRADEALSDLVVFALTTSKRDEDKLACYAHHVAGYIVKGDLGGGFQRLAEMLDAYGRIVELPAGRSS